MQNPLIMCAIAALTLCGCVSTQTRIKDKEDLLSAAGFSTRVANTPQRMTAFKTLPSDRFVTRTRGEMIEYLYADPLVCSCLYVGDQAAYNAYKKELFERDLANQQQLTAQMYNGPMAWDSWDWGPWGWRGRWW